MFEFRFPPQKIEDFRFPPSINWSFLLSAKLGNPPLELIPIMVEDAMLSPFLSNTGRAAAVVAWNIFLWILDENVDKQASFESANWFPWKGVLYGTRRLDDTFMTAPFDWRCHLVTTFSSPSLLTQGIDVIYMKWDSGLERGGIAI